jgi:hypothetical protein
VTVAGLVLPFGEVGVLISLSALGASQSVRGTCLGFSSGFKLAHALCKGTCRFSAARVGQRLTLTITDLEPDTSYYYVIAARDNVSRRLGPR